MTLLTADITSEIHPEHVSRFWYSQDYARKLIEEYGCKLCTWKYPGVVFDVSGDLWCHHCVREIGAEVASVLRDVARIPATTEQRCEWFALCDNLAVKARPHPVLNWVPICERCDIKMS